MAPPQPQVSGKPVSTSTFYMWRVIIAIAHADGMIQEQERAYLNRIIGNMDRVYGLTPEQKSAFASDLAAPEGQNIADLMRYINDPAARGQVIYFGGLLARADGVLDPREDAILKKLHADQMASLDMDQIRKDTRKAVADEMFQHDLKMSEIRPQGGLVAVLDSLLLRMGIDVME
ncbi:MAG: TerB family tellurite resistance protein [Alphaproteobacteria bacterium]|nr:MAG: TerB family tellurite resistance protein [Alphaproteobacteria bacterium]